MKIAIFSNYLNHHQLPLCKALCTLTGNQFAFVATTRTPAQRVNIGYHDMNKAHPFVLCAYDSAENRREAVHIALESDVVIIGGAPMAYVQERLQQGKLTFYYAERIYKKGYEAWKWPVRLVRQYRAFGRHKSLHLLCASAFTAADFAKTGTFVNKAYKWGYFPEIRNYNITELFERKEKNGRIKIAWAGRFLDWKHPDDVIRLAEKLVANGYDFELAMIGSGAMEMQLKAMIPQKGLSEHVHLLGSMAPEQVRQHMEAADIYLFTSDRNEGWGAVLNESMNSCCAVVASHAIGSVPFLLNDGENGMVYRDGDTDDLYKKVKYLIDHPEDRRRMGENAYLTMENAWNAETAAQRLLLLAQDLMTNKRSTRFTDGPCSPAKKLKDTWYETEKPVF